MRQRFDSRYIFAAVAAVVVMLAVVIAATSLYYFSTIHGLVVQADSITPNDQAEGTAIVGVTARMVIIVVGATLLAVTAIGALLIYRNRRELRGERHVQSIYQAIGENIDTAIFIVDCEDQVVEAVFENVQDILGVPASKFFVVDRLSSNEAYAKVAAIVHSGAPDERRTWEFQCFNAVFGRDMWLRITSCPVTLGGDAKVIYSLTDMTDEHDIRQRLMDSVAAAEDANRAKSNFLASMSHDIRTPMNAIIGMTELARMSEGDPARVDDCLAKITLSSNHLLNLINEVLDLSMIESGRLVLSAGEVDLRALACEMETMFGSRCEDAGIALSVEMDAVAHPLVEADELRLQQVFINMLGNAVKFTGPGGAVKVRMGESPGRVEGTSDYEFVFCDTGCGMAPEFLEHVFEPFAREHDSRTERVEGTGLGLSIVQSIVSLMGGVIEVQSVPDAGTKFTVRLNLRHGAGESDDVLPDAESAADALQGAHVLLVEDNELNSEIAAALLESLGLAVECAFNGREALEVLDAAEPGHFDAVLMDIQMPVMNGLEATRAIRASERADLRALPVVVLSANAFAEDVQESKHAGADDHLSKPISVKDLAAALAAILG